MESPPRIRAGGFQSARCARPSPLVLKELAHDNVSQYRETTPCPADVIPAHAGIQCELGTLHRAPGSAFPSVTFAGVTSLIITVVRRECSASALIT
jgi:hypothetical protein